MERGSRTFPRGRNRREACKLTDTSENTRSSQAKRYGKSQRARSSKRECPRARKTLADNNKQRGRPLSLGLIGHPLSSLFHPLALKRFSSFERRMLPLFTGLSQPLVLQAYCATLSDRLPHRPPRQSLYGQYRRELPWRADLQVHAA